MVATAYARIEAQRERRLARLERTYDRQGEPVRRYTQDCCEIEDLYAHKVIDRDHADLLRERARDKYIQAETKRKEKQFHHKLEIRAGNCSFYVFIAIVVTGILLGLWIT